ncbi:arylamine N-acetyltransferase family protein [Alicyclobacillus pomorum]|uniref:arylamine N-acetyltransferase family protein n=1 Tax=Alicyclobacillus pomorum TaxID=204470 RepID=UPI0012EC8F81|nr:arylamine N-acetyltransferase [Alicyclobacillus pomorum]
MCYRETKSFWTKTVSLRKLLKENAGGLCYELNRLFQWLLTELGYRAKLVAATVLNEQGEWVHQDSHATTIVSLDEKSYVVDVGFGDCVREPLPLSGEEIHDVSGTYRIIPVIGTALFDLQNKQGEKWITKFRFSTEEKQLKQFHEASRFIQTSDKSPFTQGRIVTIATPDGRITLSGHTLTMTHGDKKMRKRIREDDVPAILRQYFGMDEFVPM